MSKIFLLLLLLLGPVLRLPAQHLLGLAGSNYAGTNALYLNPASIADSRLGFHLNLFNLNANFATTYFYYNDIKSLPSGFQNALDGGDAFERQSIRERLDGKPKQFMVGIDMRLPSFTLKLSPRHSIALTTRFRSAIQATNVTEDLAHVIGLGTANPAIRDIPYASSRGNGNVHAFSEVGFSYARVLLSKEKRFLKGGFTLKKLAGIYASHLSVENMNYQVKADGGGGNYLEVQNMDMQFGYSQNEFELDEVQDKITSFNPAGRGWGLDLGFIYEHRPKFEKYQFFGPDSVAKTDHGKNKYKYRIGVALMDMGGITYKDPQAVRIYNLNRKNINLRSDDFADTDTGNLNSTIEEALDVKASEGTNSFQSGLPMALNVNLDYHLAGPLYVGATWIQNLRGEQAVAIRQNSLVALTPRLETKGFGLGFPVAMMNNYRDMSVGAMAKLGFLTIGSDNLGGILGVGKPVGADVYLGMAIGIKTGGQRAKVEKKLRKKAAREKKAQEKAVK